MVQSQTRLKLNLDRIEKIENWSDLVKVLSEYEQLNYLSKKKDDINNGGYCNHNCETKHTSGEFTVLFNFQDIYLRSPQIDNIQKVLFV